MHPSEAKEAGKQGSRGHCQGERLLCCEAPLGGNICQTGHVKLRTWPWQSKGKQTMIHKNFPRALRLRESRFQMGPFIDLRLGDHTAPRARSAPSGASNAHTASDRTDAQLSRSCQCGARVSQNPLPPPLHGRLGVYRPSVHPRGDEHSPARLPFCWHLQDSKKSRSGQASLIIPCQCLILDLRKMRLRLEKLVAELALKCKSQDF